MPLQETRIYQYLITKKLPVIGNYMSNEIARRVRLRKLYRNEAVIIEIIRCTGSIWVARKVVNIAQMRHLRQELITGTQAYVLLRFTRYYSKIYEAATVMPNKMEDNREHVRTRRPDSPRHKKTSGRAICYALHTT